ncbi:hypothetical protein PAPYR_4691 [Paratrimastix pyriformis]|uniref:Uncharacterized protein n=1 Tax=Paratrimastix pyriformis TaxID=342808 RepID=A0ABQ8UJH9_9EUKA|nr:hypothetical protein PAPYR_4691 [Paratrimastix pyriformis]
MIKKTLLLLAFRSFSTPCVQRDSSHAKLRRTKKCSAEVLFRLRSYFPENTVVLLRPTMLQDELSEARTESMRWRAQTEQFSKALQEQRAATERALQAAPTSTSPDATLHFPMRDVNQSQH